MKMLDLISRITVYEDRSELPAEWLDLLEKAHEAAKKAYSPYSNFKVGAAVLLNNGEVITGNNQENAAYPSGLCAERTATFYASAQFPEVPFNKLAITAINPKEKLTRPVSPCGSCRQALLEYEQKFKQQAFVKLKEQGMKYLIFDLRNNGGGLLQEAVNIMNIFVDQGTMISETKGKLESQHNVYKTRFPVTDKTIPVVVLVNEYSASASEIVSGAFQDLDRGVIMGRKTFGKGLVQNVLPLSYNTSMKITIAKYYIPSGRCVQNIEYFKNDTLTPTRTKIPDSLAVAYKTKNGRTVYDKGGVEPDVISPDTVASNLLLALVLNNLIFDYATQYRATHATIPEAKDFRVNDEIYNDFIHFLKDKEYTYTTETEKVLEDLKEVAEDEQYFKDISALYDSMKKKIEEEKSTELQKYKAEISDYLASEIISRYYYQKGKYVDMLRCDPEISAAKDLLLNQARYKSILGQK